MAVHGHCRGYCLAFTASSSWSQNLIHVICARPMRPVLDTRDIRGDCAMRVEEVRRFYTRIVSVCRLEERAIVDMRDENQETVLYDRKVIRIPRATGLVTGINGCVRTPLLHKRWRAASRRSRRRSLRREPESAQTAAAPPVRQPRQGASVSRSGNAREGDDPSGRA